MDPRQVFEAEPLIRRIVGWRLSGTASLQDREDVAGDILLDLVARFDAVRRGESEPVADLTGYAAVASHHGCDRYLRRRFPQRYRLATRIRYLIETVAEYEIWQEPEGFICAAAGQRGKVKVAEPRPGWASQVPLAGNANESRVVAAIFAHLNAPLRLSELVDAVALLLNVSDQTASTSDIEVAGAAHNREDQIYHRQLLARLWSEIAQLPQPQRVALLFNLRDDHGDSVLPGLPGSGVASLRDIARVLELPAEELAGLWKDLPLSDLAIAARLGISRQQVINLRKAARQRLGRRIAGNIDSPSDSKRGAELG